MYSRNKRINELAITTKPTIRRIRSIGCTKDNKKFKDTNRKSFLNSNNIQKQNLKSHTDKLSSNNSSISNRSYSTITSQSTFYNRQSFSILQKPKLFSQKDHLLNFV